jgi:hypothetical protein
MDAGEENMKERMLMIEMEYSVLKEEIEGDRCGWSKTPKLTIPNSSKPRTL